MVKNTKGSNALRWAWVFILLSIAVILSGASVCEFSALRVAAVANADSARILHDPAGFVGDVRSAVYEMMALVALGIFITMVGFCVLSVSISRKMAMKDERARVAELEEKVKKLEAASHKH